MLIAVIGNKYRRLERQRSVRHIDVYICEALLAGVCVRLSRRDYHDLAFGIRDIAVIEQKLTAAACAVYKLPVFVGVKITFYW